MSALTMTSQMTSQVAVLLLLLLAGLATCHENVQNTFGSGGVTCDGNTTCLHQDATCVNGTCQCVGANTTGLGNFDCWPEDAHHCHVVNDPVLVSMNGESTVLPVTCRVLLAHVKTTYTAWPSSTCEVKVHVWQTKRKGKVFPAGVDVALKISSPLMPAGFGEITVRKFGNATGGVYDFYERGQLAFAPDGPFNLVHELATYVPGGTISMTHDPYNNIAKLAVDDCGLNVKFRPADPSLGRHQHLLPGVPIDVSPAHDPEFLSQDASLNVPPGDPTKLKRAAQQMGLTPQQMQMYKAFTSGVQQNQPDAAEQCSVVPGYLRQCPADRLPRAMDTCHFLLTGAKAINCLDPTPNGDEVLFQYGRCVQAVCNSSLLECQLVQDAVRHCLHCPKVREFVKPETCAMVAAADDGSGSGSGAGGGAMGGGATEATNTTSTTDVPPSP